ncbi:hypothetical protein F5Y15DRAFT_420339 [Xylariaceae sp. FL0016]|nr:hypothetical protein F5Y15DRAFT_420339 [Xylariaceae sp. FL0016]
MKAPDRFRVVIIGAGPTGLALGNMLSAADVDFVILEKRESVVTDSGACIMLWPHSVRVLDQLGLLEATTNASLGLHSKAVLDSLGQLQTEHPTFRWIEENHGYPPLHLPRSELVGILHDGLRAHWSKIKTSSLINNITSDEEGVCVGLSDGTEEKGSLLVGCDGVHSQARQFVNATTATELDESTPTSEFECLYGTASPIPHLPRGTFWECHGPGMATQFAVSEKLSAFSLFRQADTTSTSHSALNDSDVARFMDDHGDRFIAPGFRIKDLQNHCIWAKLARQWEGSAKHWHGERMVLCGESAVQMSSVLGMGFNTALQGAVCLANRLQASPKPDGGDINVILTEYRASRENETVLARQWSADYIRLITTSSWLKRMVVEYVLPWIWGERAMMKKLGLQSISQGEKLSFIAHTDKEGTIPWKSM